MNISTELWTAVIAAIVSLVVSFIPFFINRRKIASSIITSERIRWNENIRAALKSFVSEYVKENPDIQHLMELKFDIEVYLSDTINSPGFHSGLKEVLKTAISNYNDNGKNKTSIIEDITFEAQVVFTESFRMIRHEAHQTSAERLKNKEAWDRVEKKREIYYNQKYNQ